MGWRLARSLVTLRAEVDQVAPHRSKVSDGTIGDPAHAARASRHNPNRHGVVTALDITHDPDGGCDIHAIARAHVAAGPHPELVYIISSGMVASRSRGWVWRTYTGSNPHTRHAHFAVGVGPDSAPEPPYDSTAPWGIAQEDDTMPVTDPDDVRYYQAILAATFDPPHDKAGPPYDLGTSGPNGDGVDGVIGKNTAAAIREWQERRGIAVTGTLTATTCITLQSHANRAHATEEASELGGAAVDLSGLAPKDHTHTGKVTVR